MPILSNTSDFAIFIRLMRSNYNFIITFYLLHERVAFLGHDLVPILLPHPAILIMVQHTE
jgi:hypothetical protein